MGQGEHVQDGAGLPGRARPHYTYSRKSTLKGNKGSVSGLEFTDNEDEDSNPKLVCCDLSVLFVVFKKKKFFLEECDSSMLGFSS